MPNVPSAELMNGTAIAGTVLDETTELALRFAADAGRRPCLAAVLVAETPPR
jgi:hypothetical protein